MPEPGEKMYGDAWMERTGSEIPQPWRNVCRNICKGFVLGNDRDILLVWDVMKDAVEQAERSAKCNVDPAKGNEK